MLRQALSTLPRQSDPHLLVWVQGWDDAGVYQIAPNLALVQTVDFFAPIVDEPFEFGEIAAANALSDVYAMGGMPLTALNIVAFPKQWNIQILSQVLLGGESKVREAGASLAGGHSVEDPQLKYGLSITGIVNPSQMTTTAGAKVGDLIILTKPLGVGILISAAKKRKIKEIQFTETKKLMKQLNNVGAQVMVTHGAHACTDITGFGFLGHALHIALASQVKLSFWGEKIPMLEQALFFARQRFVTRGEKRNLNYVKPYLFKNDLSQAETSLLLDPQTSGGLLIAVQKDRADSLLKDLVPHYPQTRMVGEVMAGSPSIEIRR